MTEERIRDFSGQVLGIVQTDEKGNKIVRNFPGMQRLGYFDAEHNVTRNFYGQIIARGDTAVSLIYDDIAKNKR